LYSSKEVTINKLDTTPVVTPIVGIDNAVIRNVNEIAPIALGLNEVYRVYDEPEPKQKVDIVQLAESKEQERKVPVKVPLSDIVQNEKKAHFLNLSIERQLANSSGICMFFSEYKGKRYPNELERDFILHTEHTYSDIPCLPITPVIVNAINNKELQFGEYLDFIKGSIEWLRSFRKKPIMGIIPSLSYANLEALMKLYADKEINAFCVDFDGRTPMGNRSVLAQCHQLLGEKDETSFFYGININHGRFIHKKNAINAKDILSFGFGIDGFGRRHRPPPFPTKEQQEKLGKKWKPLDRKKNKVRLFIKTDYGYYKVENANSIKNYPLDSCIPLATFTKNPDVIDDSVRHCEKVFNAEQLAMEAANLRSIIEKEVPAQYLNDKILTDKNDIDLIKQFKTQVKNQKTLDDNL
jgi:hypothetical protein